MNRFRLLLSMALLFTFSADAQKTGIYVREYASEIIKKEQGLSQNSVRCIMQDSHGLMWFGTWDGMNRFNGLEFDIYRPDYSTQGEQLSNPTINTIFEAKNGIFWIGTDNGLNRYNPNTGTFKAYFHDPDNPASLSNDTVKSIVQARNGKLWIGTQNGLNILQDTCGKFYRIKKQATAKGSLSSNEIRDIYCDSKDNLWISTTNGLNKWMPGYREFITFHSGGKQNRSIIGDRVNCVTELSDQRIMVGTTQGISILSKSGLELQNFSKKQPGLKSNIIMDFCVDKKGKVWVATSGGGISFYYPGKKKFVSLDDLQVYQDINENFVNTIYEDRQNIIWIGYARKGLKKVVLSSSYFPHFAKSDGENQGMLSNSVWSMAELSKSKVFIGTEKGINIFNEKTESFDALTTSDALSSNNIRAMSRDSDDNIWIGTLKRGLMKYDINRKSFEYFGRRKQGKCPELYNNTIWAIMEGSENDIWLGTHNGLYRLKPDSGILKKYRHKTEKGNSSVVYSLYEDQHKNIWLGTYSGLKKYDRSKRSFEVYKHQGSDENSISTNRVFDINQDADGYLWIGTMGGGLNRMDPYNGNFRHFTEKDGLSNNVVYNIIIDSLGYLWLSTNKGLSRFDPENKSFVNYDINDGIQSYEFNYGAAFINSEGRIFMGGMNGFNAFYPSNIRENHKKPELVISDIRILNKQLPGCYFSGDSIILSHDDNFLSIRFAALDYTNPVKNQYKYKLKPVSEKWINTTADNNVAEFTELSPGAYEFRLLGSNSDGVWNKEGLTLHVIVKPAWYQTRLFRYGSMTFVVGIIVLGGIGLNHRIKKKHQTEKQFLELERKAMRLQMKPHFIFNTLNSIQNYILEHNKDSAIRYLNKFSRMMRQILYNSDNSYVPLSDEIELLKTFMELERLRFDKAFEYEVNIDDSLEEDFIAIPPMLIQPHVENAILHGLVNRKDDQGRLTLSFYEHSQNTIKCVVDDNGIGRDSSLELQEKDKKSHKSRGVSNTKQRLYYISKLSGLELNMDYKDKYDKNGNPEGTVVTLIIPVKDI